MKLETTKEGKTFVTSFPVIEFLNFLYSDSRFKEKLTEIENLIYEHTENIQKDFLLLQSDNDKLYKMLQKQEKAQKVLKTLFWIVELTVLTALLLSSYEILAR